MNYGSKDKIKKNIQKKIQFIFKPLVNGLEKLDAWQYKKKEEKRYTEKQIRQMFVKMIDYYLYISSNNDLTNGIEGEEAIMLMDEIIYSTDASGIDFYDIEHFYRNYYHPDKRTGKKLEHCRRKQYDMYHKIFKEFCDYGESYNNEMLKEMFSYTSGTGTTYLSSFYNDVENVPCYKLTRTRFEEIKKNG